MDPDRAITASAAGHDHDHAVITADPAPPGESPGGKRSAAAAAAAERARVRPGRRTEQIRSSRPRPSTRDRNRARGSLTTAGRSEPPRRRLRPPRPHATIPATPPETTAAAAQHPWQLRTTSSGRHRRRARPVIATVKLIKDVELGGLWVVLAVNSPKPAVCVALATMALTHLVVTAAKKWAPNSRLTVVAALVKDVQLGGMWLTLAANTVTPTVGVALAALAITHLVVVLSTCGERFAKTGTPQHVGGGITTGANEATHRPDAAAAST